MKDVDNASQTKTNVNIFSTVGGKAIIIIPIFLFLSSFKENQIGPLFKMILTKLCFLCIDILCAAIFDLFLFWNPDDATQFYIDIKDHIQE